MKWMSFLALDKIYIKYEINKNNIVWLNVLASFTLALWCYFGGNMQRIQLASLSQLPVMIR